jgi:glycogen debranching enzyme
MSRAAFSTSQLELVEECRLRAIALLRANLGPQGILAAAPSPRAAARGYRAVFSRDAAVCAIGMALSGDALLERGGARGLVTLAAHQARNGQIAKFVEPEGREADFWYLGCIDATLWWLIALALLDRRAGAPRLRRRFAGRVRRALDWLGAQEHQRFRLLQQNEASDWADIMPRSGFVLYTNALWVLVKRLYRLPQREETLANANHLFHPFDGGVSEYRRARLLADYARRNAKNRGLYLSFVNFAAYGDEGDVFGNLLAVLCGMADRAQSARVLRALRRAGVHRPYPVRAVCDPIASRSRMWRPYMSRHRQNFAWQYHNGGIWPFVGGFWVIALAQAGERAAARAELLRLAEANALGRWGFSEWLHGRSAAPSGMRGQSWNAAAYLVAWHAVCAAPSAARAQAWSILAGTPD